MKTTMLSCYKISQKIGLTFAFIASLLLSSLVWSNDHGIARDDASEAVIANQILRDQQANSLPSNELEEVTHTNTNVQIDGKKAEESDSIRGLPNLNEPVIDQANVLSAAQKQTLSKQILQLHETGKAQIGIVIVPTTGQESIFDYAMRVGEAWQLGSAKRDNGLLIAIATEDRRIQILTGYGLEGVLPDVVASQIIRQHITPYFKEGRYAEGIQAALNEIDYRLNLDPEVAKQAAADLKERQAQALHEQQARSDMLFYSVIILFVGMFASALVGNRVSAATAGVAGVVAGLVSGIGIIGSLLAGLGIFILLVTSIAQFILHAILSSSGNGGGGRGGGFGGGGYSGGGGRFGGGGASGSW